MPLPASSSTYLRLSHLIQQQRGQASLASADVLTDDDYVPFVYPTNTVLPVSEGQHSGWPPPVPVSLAEEGEEGLEGWPDPDIEIVEPFTMEAGEWWGGVEGEVGAEEWGDILEGEILGATEGGEMAGSTEGVGAITEVVENPVTRSKTGGGGKLRNGGKRPAVLAREQKARAEKLAASEAAQKVAEIEMRELEEGRELSEVELELEKLMGLSGFGEQAENQKEFKRVKPDKKFGGGPRARKFTQQSSEKQPYQKKVAGKSSEKRPYKEKFAKKSPVKRPYQTEFPGESPEEWPYQTEFAGGSPEKRPYKEGFTQKSEEMSFPELKPRRYKDTWHLPPIDGRVEPTPLQAYVASRPRNTIERWRVDKAHLQAKFGGAHWSPLKKLSPEAQDAIRLLHKNHPEFSTQKLSERFEVSPDAIRRILKSKWRANADEATIEDTKERWERRKDSVWERWVEMEVVRTKKMKKAAMKEKEAKKVRWEERKKEEGHDVETSDGVPKVNLGTISSRLL